MLVNGKSYRTVWMEKNIVRLINQPLIPHDFEIYGCLNHEETAKAIKNMVVRGAGAIGAAAGYAIAQAALEANENNFDQYILKAADTIKNTRPTAQNLFYAVERILNKLKENKGRSAKEKKQIALKEAQAIADEDVMACKKIGQHGEELIKDGYKILTHCNAGWLAFVDWGSALSPVYAAKRSGKKVFVYADETRPRCQGARLTAWELGQEGIAHAIIADNAAGYFMKKGEVDIVIVGSDRIAANGDVANKIGTYEKAVLAKENDVPFYVAAPTTTIDTGCSSGDIIPIEERSEEEVLYMFGHSDSGKFDRVRIAPKESKAKNPAFDITPAKYIKGIITEKGIVKPNDLKDIF